jgi:hypothetical protein
MAQRPSTVDAVKKYIAECPAFAIVQREMVPA